MSITKTKTKMKSGTIAVIALSIVLVLSLITTITLAYFTATRNVVTTIQFANGVRLQMAGAYVTDGENNTTGSYDSPGDNGWETPASLYWKATYANNGVITGEGTGTYTGVGDTINFETLKVNVLDLDSYVAVRIAVTGSVTATSDAIDMHYVAAVPGDPGTPAKEAAGIASYVRPQLTSEWMEFANVAGTYTNIEGNGWYVYKGNGSAPASMTAGAEALQSNSYDFSDATTIVNSWALPTDNSFAGKTIVVTVTVFASNTLAGLQETVNNWNGSHAAAATTGFAKASDENQVAPGD